MCGRRIGSLGHISVGKTITTCAHQPPHRERPAFTVRDKSVCIDVTQKGEKSLQSGSNKFVLWCSFRMKRFDRWIEHSSVWLDCVWWSDIFQFTMWTNQDVSFQTKTKCVVSTSTFQNVRVARTLCVPRHQEQVTSQVSSRRDMMFIHCDISAMRVLVMLDWLLPLCFCFLLWKVAQSSFLQNAIYDLLCDQQIWKSFAGQRSCVSLGKSHGKSGKKL